MVPHGTYTFSELPYSTGFPKTSFFRVVRTIGLSLAAAGGVLIAAPVAVPAGLVTLGGYLIVAGTVATAVAQTTTMNEKK